MTEGSKPIPFFLSKIIWYYQPQVQVPLAAKQGQENATLPSGFILANPN
jgi:hypothetical protein